MTTLAELRSAVRRETDTVNSQNPTDTELTEFINGSAAELWDLLVTEYEDQYTSRYTQVLSGSSNSIDMPDDFFKLRGLDRSIDGTHYVPVERVTHAERDDWDWVVAAPDRMRYFLEGNTIYVLPGQGAAGTFRVIYIPRYTALSAGTDALFDVPNNWHEYIVVDAAIKLRDRREEDVSVLMARKDRLARRIQAAASNRDLGGAKRVAAVSRHRDRY